MAYDSSHYRMADRLVNGQLEAILAGYRAAGLSAGQIVSRLYAEHGIEITAPTALKWRDALPEEVAS